MTRSTRCPARSSPQGPVRGPDGLFHVVWVWRDTPDRATNHHLSYARSRDLQRWETLPAHHDRQRKGPLPPPSVLELVRLNKS